MGSGSQPRALRVELVQHGASASVAYFGFIDTEMVRQGVDRDPLVKDMMSSLPKPLRKRLAPSVAGERDEQVQAHLRQLDARAGEDQPTSA